jgi:LysR family hydrogen peroxide-inducible transcriptional activator
LLEEIRATEALLRGEGGEGEMIRGTVRIGVIPTVAPYVMPGALRHFRARHAAVRVELREDYSAVLAEQLYEGALDVVIAAQPYAFDAFEVEPLGTDALLVAVPSTHTAARAGRITLAQLRESPAITLDPMHCLGAQVTGFCASRDIEPSVVCRSAQLATVLALVGAGVGVSIVPALAATQHNTPQCVYVPLVEQELRREIVAVWRKGSERRAGARAIIASVRALVAAGAPDDPLPGGGLRPTLWQNPDPPLT